MEGVVSTMLWTALLCVVWGAIGGVLLYLAAVGWRRLWGMWPPDFHPFWIVGAVAGGVFGVSATVFVVGVQLAILLTRGA